MGDRPSVRGGDLMQPRRTRDQSIRQARRDQHQRPGRKPWPVLTDRTAIDRARTTARLLLDACHSDNPAAAADAITEAVRRAGETWLAPIPDLAPDTRRLSEKEAGAMLGISGNTIRQWGNRGVLILGPVPTHSSIQVRGRRMYLHRLPGGGYAEEAVLAFDAAMRTIHPTTEEDAA